MTRNWTSFDLLDLKEILACLNDSDRYIVLSTKTRIIEELEHEIELRNEN